MEGERAKHGQDEAIEFDYTIGEDEPEIIASEMVSFFLSILFGNLFDKNIISILGSLSRSFEITPVSKLINTFS